MRKYTQKRIVKKFLSFLKDVAGIKTETYKNEEMRMEENYE